MTTITVVNPPPVIVKSKAIGPVGPPGPVPPNPQFSTVGFVGEFGNGVATSENNNITIEWTNGQYQNVTLAADCTLTIRPPAYVCHNQLRIIQDSVGGHNVTWQGLNPNRWMGSTSEPPINSISNGETVVNMFFDGVNILQSMGRIGTP